MKLLLVACALFALANAAPKTLPKLDGRIVGGSPVTIEAHPYQASVLYFGSHICGGVNIGSRYVLTAAHCTEGGSAQQFSVRVASSFVNTGGMVVAVSVIYQHPGFISNTFDNDVSILYLASPIAENSGIDFIDLVPYGTDVPDGLAAFVTGWGTLQEGGNLPDHLQGVSVYIVGNNRCREAYGDSSITDNMICAGYTDGGRDACQGDSGGPLTVGSQLVGIVSWGFGCARPSYPGVYASVPALHAWITSITGV